MMYMIREYVFGLALQYGQQNNERMNLHAFRHSVLSSPMILYNNTIVVSAHDVCGLTATFTAVIYR